jgi:predicted metal-dependent peptidase
VKKEERRKYESIFQDALGLLIKHHAFFGHIMANTVRVEDSKVRVLSLSITSESKISLHYNLEDIKYEMEENNLTLPQLTAMVQHTIYHMINEHFLRKVDGDYETWVVTPDGPVELFDLSSDLSINQFIQSLPKNAVTLDSFDETLPPEENAEYYFKILLDRVKQNKEDIENQMHGSMDFGDAEGALFFKPSGKTNEEKQTNKEEQIQDIAEHLPFGKNEFMRNTQQDENRQPGMNGKMIDDHTWEDIRNTPKEIVRNTVKDIVKKAYHQAKYGQKSIGTLPAGIERMIADSFKKPYNFRPLLKRFVDGHLFSHHEGTRRRPNRRFGYVYPGKKSVMQAKVGVLGDTSGSMSDEELGMIVKNMNDINQYAQVILFEVDSAIHNISEFNPRKFKKMLKGGGGTSFEDVFRVIERYSQNKHLLDNLPLDEKNRAHQYIRDLKVLIIITDGGVYGLPDRKPKIPVMWALTSKCQTAPVSWGKVVYLDNDPESHRG